MTDEGEAASDIAERWFGVRTVLFFEPDEYEERVTLWRARDLDNAIELAETEAQEHAAIVEGEYLGFAQAYGPIDDGPVVGAEVYSLKRHSALRAGDYLQAFFATGTEHETPYR